MVECLITLLIVAIAIPASLLGASVAFCVFCEITGKDIEEQGGVDYDNNHSL